MYWWSASVSMCAKRSISTLLIIWCRREHTIWLVCLDLRKCSIEPVLKVIQMDPINKMLRAFSSSDFRISAFPYNDVFFWITIRVGCSEFPLEQLQEKELEVNIAQVTFTREEGVQNPGLSRRQPFQNHKFFTQHTWVLIFASLHV